MAKLRDLVGRKFSKLTVIELIGISNHHALWKCVCECGNVREVASDKLTLGNTRSCGCTNNRKVHGLSKSPTYSSWQSMIARCTNPSNPSFEYYQRRGIKVCDRWRTFANFLADMGERPSASFTIDRFPNNDGNYEPGNCRWATKTQQANNRSTNKTFFYQGRVVTFAELVRLTGLGKEFLRHRLMRANWSVEDAILIPPSKGKRRIERRYP